MSDCTWVTETVSHIIQDGIAVMCSMDKLLHGHIDVVSLINNDRKALTYVDEKKYIGLYEHHTGDTQYRVFSGNKLMVIDTCKYFPQNNIFIYDKQSNTYVSILIGVSKIMKRFKTNMYSGVRNRVYKELFKFYYMADIDFNDNDM